MFLGSLLFVTAAKMQASFLRRRRLPRLRRSAPPYRVAVSGFFCTAAGLPGAGFVSVRTFPHGSVLDF